MQYLIMKKIILALFVLNTIATYSQSSKMEVLEVREKGTIRVVSFTSTKNIYEQGGLKLEIKPVSADKLNPQLVRESFPSWCANPFAFCLKTSRP